MKFILQINLPNERKKLAKEKKVSKTAPTLQSTYHSTGERQLSHNLEKKLNATNIGINLFDLIFSKKEKHAANIFHPLPIYLSWCLRATK